MTNRFRLVHLGIAAAALGVFVGPGTARALDHFLCYTAAAAKGEPKLVNPGTVKSFKDQLETRFYDAKKVKWHCNPTEKIHNGVTTDISDAALHLEGYQIALTKPDTVNVTVKQKELAGRLALVRNQFGEAALKIIAPESAEIRASKTVIHSGAPVACSATKPCAVGSCLLTAGTCVSDQTFPAAPADLGTIDNFKCYKVAMQSGIKFTPIVNAVQAQDQFGGACAAATCTAGDPAKHGTVCTSNAACDGPGATTGNGVCGPSNPTLAGTFCTSNAACDGPGATTGNGVCGGIAYDIIKPTRLCMPVNKNNENPGADQDPDHLLCYQVKLSKSNKPKFPKFLVADSNTNYPNTRLNLNSGAKEICLPSSKRMYFCGDGVIDQPFEDCDAPKLCQGGINPGAPCKAAADCTGGTCVPNITQCANNVACSKTCQCPMLSGPQAYHVSDFSVGINVFTPLLGGNVSFNLDAAAAGGGGKTTLQLNVGAPDAAGVRSLAMDKDSWVFDSILIHSSTSIPFDLTVRLCADTNLAGSLHTKSGGDNDYTSTTNDSGTTYVVGDGKADKPGSALADVTLRADIWLGDRTCTGTGVDTHDSSTNCLTCAGGVCAVGGAACGGDADCASGVCNASVMPAGRIGVQALSAPPSDTPTLAIPLDMKLTTVNDENKVVQPGDALDGSEVTGHGYLVTGQSLRMNAANAKLNFDSGFAGIIDAQFTAAEGFSPACPASCLLPACKCLP